MNLLNQQKKKEEEDKEEEEEGDISPLDYRTCDTCSKRFVPRQQWGKWHCFRHPGQKVFGDDSDWDGPPRWSCCGIVDEMVGHFPGRFFATDLWGCTPCDHHCANTEGPRPEFVLLAAHTPEAHDTLRHVVRLGFTSQETEDLDTGMVKHLFSRIVPEAYSDPRFWTTLETRFFATIRTRVETSRSTAFPVKNYYSGRPRQLAAEDRTDAEIIAEAKRAESSFAEAIATELARLQVPVPLAMLSTGAAGPEDRIKNRIARFFEKQ
jgi:hypothetical protein